MHAVQSVCKQSVAHVLSILGHDVTETSAGTQVLPTDGMLSHQQQLENKQGK